MKLMATADLHCCAESNKLLEHLLGGELQNASALLLGGDLTNRGLPREAECLASQVNRLTIPVVAVLGNHDYESGQVEEVKQILRNAGVHLLQGEVWMLSAEVGIAGIKGFVGGYDSDQLSAFGEPEMKDFVEVCVREADQLASALQNMHSREKIALMHYTPVRGTLQGESPEGFIFQGASRLAEAAEKGGATMILHGHSHFGSPYGSTASGLPVYNVCRYVLTAYFDRSYWMIEV